MQRDTCFALVVVIVMVLVGITAMVLDFLTFKAYKRTTNLLGAKAKGGVTNPEDVINLIIAEAKKMGITPSKIVVGKNSAWVDFNRPGGKLEQSKE